MLSFNFRSLSFKPGIDSQHKFFVKIELPDGSCKLTETTMYNPSKNIAVFSESFEFYILDVNEIPYYNIEVNEYSDQLPNKTRVVSKKSMHISKKVGGENNVSMSSIFDSNLVLNYSIELSDDFKSETATEPSEAGTPRNPQQQDGMFGLKKDLDLLFAGALFKRFVEAMSPLVQIKRESQDFFSWKDPKKTLLYSLAMTVMVLYYRHLGVVFLTAFFFYGNHLLSSILKVKAKKIKKDYSLYKQNTIMVQQIMELTVYLHEYYLKLIDREDRSTLIKLLLQMKRVSLVLAVGLLFVNPFYLAIGGYWLLLAYNVPQGKHTITLVIDFINQGIDFLNGLIRDKIKSENFIVPTEQQKEAAKKNAPDSKTFTIYENQRWWLGKGWCTQMFPGERGPWSDFTGETERRPDQFYLPSDDWEWLSEWTPSVNKNTDGDGWEYALDFGSQFHPVKKTIDVVRRRKWTRRCSTKQNEQ